MLYALHKTFPISIKMDDGAVTISGKLDKDTVESLRKSDMVADISTVSGAHTTVKLHKTVAIASPEYFSRLSLEQAIEAAWQLIAASHHYTYTRLQDSVPHILNFVENGELRFLLIPGVDNSNHASGSFLGELIKELLVALSHIFRGFESVLLHFHEASKADNSLLNIFRFVNRLKAVYDITNGWHKELVPVLYSDSDAIFTGLLTIRKHFLRDLLSLANRKGDNVNYVIRTFSEDLYEYSILINAFVIPALRLLGLRAKYQSIMTEANYDAVFLSYDLSLNLDNIGLLSTTQFIYACGKYACEVNDTAFSHSIQRDNTRITQYRSNTLEPITEKDVLIFAQQMCIKIDMHSKTMLRSLACSSQLSYSELHINLSSLLLQNLVTFKPNRQLYEFEFYNANLSARTIGSPWTRDELTILRILCVSASGLTTREIISVMKLMNLELESISSREHSIDFIATSLENRGAITQIGCEFQSVKVTATQAVLASLNSQEKSKYIHALIEVTASSRPVEHAYYTVISQGVLRSTHIKLAAAALKTSSINTCIPNLIESTEEKLPEPLQLSNEAFEFYSAACHYFKSQCNAEELIRIYNIISKAHFKKPLRWSSFAEAVIYALKRRQQYDKAIAFGAKYLDKLGISIPLYPNQARIFLKYVTTKGSLLIKGRHHPVPTEDERILAANRVIEGISGAAYMYRPLLFPYLMAISVDLTLEHGATPESAFGLAAFAFCCREFSEVNSILGSNEEAAKLLRYSRTYSRSFDNQYDDRIKLIEHGFVSHWRSCQKESSKILLKVHETSATTDPEYALYSAAIGACLAFCRGMPLADLRSRIDVPILHARHFGQLTSLANMSLIAQFVDICSEGEAVASDHKIPSLSDPWLAAIQSTDRTVAAVFLTLRATIAVLDRDFADALRIIKAAKQFESGVQGQQLIAWLKFLEAWSLAHFETNAKYKNNFKDLLEWHRRWMRDAPQNASSRTLALEALRERRQRQQITSLAAALQSAKSEENWLLSTIIADSYFNQASVHGTADQAEHSKNEVFECLERWGAHAKLRRLKERFNFPTISESEDHKAKDPSVIRRFDWLFESSANTSDVRTAFFESVHALYSCNAVTAVMIHDIDLLSATTTSKAFSRERELTSAIARLGDSPEFNEIVKSPIGKLIQIHDRLYSTIYKDDSRTVLIEIIGSISIRNDYDFIALSVAFIRLTYRSYFVEDKIEKTNHQLKSALGHVDRPDDQKKRQMNIVAFLFNHLQLQSEALEALYDKGVLSNELAQSGANWFNSNSLVFKQLSRHLDEFSRIKPHRILHIHGKQQSLTGISEGVLEAAGHTLIQVPFFSRSLQDRLRDHPDLVIVSVPNAGDVVAVAQTIEATDWSSKRPFLIRVHPCSDYDQGYDGLFDKEVPSNATIVEWLLIASSEKRRHGLRSVSISVV